jgi:hypothetical protein
MSAIACFRQPRRPHWIIREASYNLCPMSKAFQREQRIWQYIKVAGKGRFVRRSMLGSFAIGVVTLPGLALMDRSTSHSARADFLASVIVLLAFLSGGYLMANRLWQDLEKKYSEDRLPPWE